MILVQLLFMGLLVRTACRDTDPPSYTTGAYGDALAGATVNTSN
jgi:hypothetical protein